MKDFIFRQRYFLLPWLMVLAIGMIYIGYRDKGDAILWVIPKHHVVLDYLFYFGTKIVEWPAIVGIVTIMIWKKKKIAWVVVGSWLMSVLISQGLKMVFHTPRPKKFFGQEVFGHLDVSHMYYDYSFPSGHTSMGFALFFALSFFTKSAYSKMFLFFMAFLVGLSRIYRMQHFVEDVVFGSLVGVFSAGLVYYLVDKYQKPHIIEKKSDGAAA